MQEKYTYVDFFSDELLQYKEIIREFRVECRVFEDLFEVSVLINQEYTLEVQFWENNYIEIDLFNYRTEKSEIKLSLMNTEVAKIKESLNDIYKVVASSIEKNACGDKKWMDIAEEKNKKYISKQ